ncbi:uncharacterized protein UDID_05800 [Ustilago sp. UG-2017a]|nr:uncharacterized protein UDID_05800 [Ustilago sp. UG-2017a]
MTRADAAPHSVAELQKDKHSHSLPGSSSGPNKAGNSAPSGAAILGTEIGAERDARRELAAARRDGEDIPGLADSNPSSTSAAALGFGQLNGADQGISTPGQEKRGQMQTERNAEFNKAQPDLRKLAASSASSASNTTQGAGEEQYRSSGSRNPDELLETASRSTGTESGTGAAGNGTGEIEVGRDATTTA